MSGNRGGTGMSGNVGGEGGGGHRYVRVTVMSGNVGRGEGRSLHNHNITSFTLPHFVERTQTKTKNNKNTTI